MVQDSGGNNKNNNGKEVLKMGVWAKPIRVTFAVRADKIKEFRNINNSKTMLKIQEEAKKIKNISIEDFVYEKK